MTRPSRIRLVAVSCVLAVVSTAALTGARAWALAQADSMCRRAAHTVAATAATRPAPAPSAGPRSAQRRQWRIEALRVAGCTVLHEVRRRHGHRR